MKKYLQQLKEYTLFLDRDGVINKEQLHQYINRLEDFYYYDHSLKAIVTLSQTFGKTFIVTNQKGISKGITPLEIVESIHNKIIADVMESGGHLDGIYFCEDGNDDSINRKPNNGMALQAKEKFPEIDLRKSVMIGNTLSDMHFGRKTGSFTIFIRSTRPEVDLHDPAIDIHFLDLHEAANWIISTAGTQHILDKTIR